MRRLLLLPPLVALAACGGSSSSGSITGQLTDVGGRACVRTTVDDGVCYDATPEQLAGLATGDCVTLAFTKADSGTVGRATSLTRVPAPCSSG